MKQENTPRILIKEDAAVQQPTILITVPRMDTAADALCRRLQTALDMPAEPPKLSAYNGDTIVFLAPDEILRVYSEKKKVLCEDLNGRRYSLRMRLYTAEEQLASEHFVRISQSELVNADRILRLDVSIAGTIAIILENGQKTYTSRRYVSKLKTFFGL